MGIGAVGLGVGFGRGFGVGFGTGMGTGMGTGTEELRAHPIFKFIPQLLPPSVLFAQILPGSPVMSKVSPAFA
jgi:hypothetical protein